MTAIAAAGGDQVLAAEDAPHRRIGTVAVIAHRKKSLGGGLDELRSRLADYHIDELLWFEVVKSKKAPKQVKRALQAGADLVVVWGGDGMVQRCADTLAGSGVPVGIIPAGTANLLAHNLDLPDNLAEALRVALTGRHRSLDLGKINGEHFAVMVGVGFDADMIRDVDSGMKDRLGRLAYFVAPLPHTRRPATPTRITMDGTAWFDGVASCVLLGNVGRITGGIPAFDDARPDDGWLELGVTTAEAPMQWARTLGHIVAGRTARSPFVRTTRARKVTIKLAAARTYELDGGDRARTDRLTVRAVPDAITVCVPE